MRKLSVLLSIILFTVAGYAQVWDENGYPVSTNESILNNKSPNRAKPVYDDNMNVTGYVKKTGEDYEVYDKSMGYKGVINEYDNSYQYERYGTSNYRYNTITGEYEDTRETVDIYNNNQQNNKRRSSDRYSTTTRDKVRYYRNRQKAEYNYYKLFIDESKTDEEGRIRFYNRYGEELEAIQKTPPSDLDYNVVDMEDGTVYYVYVRKEFLKLMYE